jgi:hypothetical protein
LAFGVQVPRAVPSIGQQLFPGVVEPVEEAFEEPVGPLVEEPAPVFEGAPSAAPHAPPPVCPTSQIPVGVPSSGLVHGTQRSSLAQASPSPRVRTLEPYFATCGTQRLRQRPSAPLLLHAGSELLLSERIESGTHAPLPESHVSS